MAFYPRKKMVKSYGYKRLRLENNYTKYVICKLLIPKDAITTKYGCKMKTNKAIIESIYDDKEQFIEAYTLNNPSVLFVVGKELTTEFEDPMHNQFIYYYTNELNAQMEKINPYDKNYTGKYKEWYEDGTLKLSCTHINGRRYGMVKEYYPTGYLSKLYWIEDGKINGLCQKWNNERNPL